MCREISEIASKRADQLVYKFFSHLRGEIFRVSRNVNYTEISWRRSVFHYNFPVDGWSPSVKKMLRYISKLLYVISRAFRLIILLFVYITTRKRFVIFTCRYFKLSWNTNVLSQSNCRNFSCSSRIIIIIIIIIIILKTGVPKKQIAVLLFSWSILHEKAGSSTDCSYFSGSSFSTSWFSGAKFSGSYR